MSTSRMKKAAFAVLLMMAAVLVTVPAVSETASAGAPEIESAYYDPSVRQFVVVPDQPLKGDLITEVVKTSPVRETVYTETVLSLDGNTAVYLRPDVVNGVAYQVTYGTFHIRLGSMSADVEYKERYDVSVPAGVTATPSSAEPGTDIVLTVEPPTGKTVGSVSADNAEVVKTSGNVYGFSMPCMDVSVSVTFVAETYSVEPSQFEHGKVEASGTFQYGQTVVLTAVPDAGYSLSDLKVNNGDVPLSGEFPEFSFTMPACDAVVSASFSKDPVNVTGVTLDRETVTLDIGGICTLTATVEPADADNTQVSWSSDRTDVATVKDGKVTAVSEGTAVITVTTADGGFTDTCTVTVNPEPPAELVSIDAVHSEKAYTVGDSLDRSAVKVTAKYSDGSEADVTSQTDFVPEKFDRAGQTEVTAEFGGKTDTFTVTVNEKPAPVLTGIDAVHASDKTYVEGDSLDRSKVTVTAAYSDGSTADVTSKTVFDPDRFPTAGTVTVTAEFEGKTDTFDVTVREAPSPPGPGPEPAPVLRSIEVTGDYRTEYTVGDSLDKTGIVVNAKYSDGSSRTVTSSCTFEPEVFGTPGKVQVVVTYQDKQDSFEVDVKEAVPADPEVDVDASGGKVSEDAADAAIEQMEAARRDNPGKTPELTVESSDSVSVEMPSRLISSVVENGADLTVVTTGGTVVFPAGSLSGIDLPSAENVKVVLSETGVPAGHEDFVGDGKVYSVLLELDGKAHTANFGKEVSVSVDYVLGDGQDPENIQVHHLAEDGSTSEVPSEYSAANGTVTFRTAHFSDYAVKYVPSEVPGPDTPEEDGGSWTWIAVAAILIAAIAVIGLYLLKSRRD